MGNPDRERWNRKYREFSPGAPSGALLLHLGRLTRGRALDVAGGPGENARLLARSGFRVTTFDLSDRAVHLARGTPAGRGGGLAVVQADARHLPFRGPFETIVVTLFLDRHVAPELAALLSPGGTIFCEQPTRGLRDEYCAQPGEFPRLFRGLETLLDTTREDRALYLGRRP